MPWNKTNCDWVLYMSVRHLLGQSLANESCDGVQTFYCQSEGLVTRDYGRSSPHCSALQSPAQGEVCGMLHYFHEHVCMLSTSPRLPTHCSLELLIFLPEKLLLWTMTKLKFMWQLWTKKEAEFGIDHLVMHHYSHGINGHESCTKTGKTCVCQSQPLTIWLFSAPWPTHWPWKLLGTSRQFMVPQVKD